MLDKIVAYDTILETQNFVAAGDGNLPWSHKHTGDDGMYIEIAGNKWIMYTAAGEEVDSGRNPAELKLSFKLIYG